MSSRILFGIVIIVACAVSGSWAAGEGALYGSMAWLANPSLLAHSSTGRWEVCLAQADAGVRNNALSLDLYRTYNGEFLDEEDKQNILDRISGDTARGALQGQVEALGIHVGRIAFLSRTYVGADVGLDKDLIDLMFFGNALDRRYELLSSGGMLTYFSLGGAYGAPTGDVAGWQTGAGIAGRIVLGALAARITESSINVLTEVGGVNAQGTNVVQRSTDDEGASRPVSVAFDVGGYAAKDQWELEIVLKDLGPSLSWSEGEESLMEFEVVDWTAELGDSGYATTDTTYDIGSWSTPLPTRMQLSLTRQIPWGAVYARWEQGFRTWAGVTTTPRLHTGIVWTARPWVSPWLELGMGSPEGFGISTGCALSPGPVRLHLGVSGFRIPTSHSEALGFQLGLGFGGG